MASTAPAWLVTIKKPSHRAAVRPELRLFCFPYAGGGVAAFRKWPENLPQEVEVVVIQYPGRGSRLLESPYPSTTALISALLPVLMEKLDLPFAFFGHSLGSLLAFETARALAAAGLPAPAHLWLSGRGAAHFPDPHEQLHRLSDADFVERLKKFNGTPSEILANAELMEIFLPVLRADFTLNETYSYQPGPLLACPATVFGGRADPRVDLEALHGWRELFTGAFELETFPGDHFFVHAQESQVLSRISRVLDAILGLC